MNEFKRKWGFLLVCLVVFLFCFVSKHLLPILYQEEIKYSSTGEIVLQELEIQLKELSWPLLWFQHSIARPVRSIRWQDFLRWNERYGFSALYKYDHLLSPTYLCSHSFCAHFNCPICLTQSINVYCLHLKLTLDGFWVSRVRNCMTNTAQTRSQGHLQATKVLKCTLFQNFN